MMKYPTILLFILMLCFVRLQGQTDTLNLPTVLYTTKRSQKVSNTTYQSATETLQSKGYRNVAQVLANENNVYIKSYGLGSLATSSVRGGNAGQTLVLWNGLPLTSPMLGQLDLSLLNLQSDRYTFEKGGNSARYGSGAVTGLLNLENNAISTDKKAAQVSMESGSFGLFEASAKVHFKLKKVQAVTSLSHRFARNDFSYPLAPGLPERRQSNARFAQQNLLQSFYRNTAKHGDFSLHFWYQNSARQIPPTNVQNLSLARQDDRAWRFSGNWKKVKDKTTFEAKTGLFFESLDYFDEQIGLESFSDFQIFTGEFTVQQKWSGNHTTQWGLTNYFNRAQTVNYQNAREENRTAFFARHRLTGKNTALSFSLRQEFIGTEALSFIPNAEFSFYPTPVLKVYAKLSKDFRLPTFNDRFWVPGGNPELQAEQGWTQELGWSLSGKKTSLSGAGFHRLIDNYIFWSLKPENSFFSAENLTKVRSYGGEISLGQMIDIKALQVHLKANYAYTRSENQVATESPRIAAGQQLFYIPTHLLNLSTELRYKGFSLLYVHNFTDRVIGLNEEIAAYQNADLNLNYSCKIKKTEHLFSLRINNLYDADYFVIERRPMPGRWFSIRWQGKINRKN